MDPQATPSGAARLLRGDRLGVSPDPTSSTPDSVDEFVLALRDPLAYGNRYGRSATTRWDKDQDGDVDFDDIGDLVVDLHESSEAAPQTDGGQLAKLDSNATSFGS